MNVSKQEYQEYVKYLQQKYNRIVKTLDVEIDGDYVELHYTFEPVSFERIRRITGYLVGTMESWNNAKRAEESDRVKHSSSDFEKI